MAQKKKQIQGKNREYIVGKGKPPVEHQFKKNNGEQRDPRINRKGRPKNFDEVRALFKDIAGEELGRSGLTRIEAMGLKLSSSKNGNDNRLFLEYGFGKVKDELEIDDKSLTDDERVKRLAEILDAARARRDRQTADGASETSDA